MDGITTTTSIDNTASVTSPVNTDATFTATATAGTPRFVGVSGWTIQGDPTYKWYVATAAPDAQTAAAPGTRSAAAPAAPPPTLPITYLPETIAKTTVTIPGASPARTDGYVVTITCEVRYGALGPDGKQKGYLNSSLSKTFNVYLIGGPITGDQDEYFFCSDNLPGGNIDALGYLYAAPNQPAGTTYSWSISGSAIYCDADGNAAIPTTASTRYRGTHPGSSAVGDVTANVTYSLNNVSAKSSPDWKITAHVPKTFIIPKNGTTPAIPYAYGFSGQSLRFQVLDCVGLPFPPNRAYWSESWSGTGDRQPNAAGGPLDEQGYSVDSFNSGDGLHAPSDPNDPYGDKILGPLTHTYSITHIGGTGGLIGCKIQVYTDVYYYTYQMPGNGFPPKAP